MRNSSSEASGDDPESGGRQERGASIDLALPVREAALFKHGATTYVLDFLGDNPDIDVSIRQLSAVVPFSERSTREAVDVLEANDLVETFHSGNARRVHVNRSRLDRPSDPVSSVPQAEFHTAVRVARRFIEDELDGVEGIVLFGSVARGEADRRSDVDLWVLVRGDHMEQRHAANKLAKRLDGMRIPRTVAVADARDATETDWAELRRKLEADEHDWPDAQRYTFEIVVETPESILGQQDRVDAETLFGEGITLSSTETLDRVKLEVLGGE